MFPISDETRELFLKEYRQLAEMVITAPGGSQITVTDSDIVEGSLSVDRYCISGNKIELGSAIAGELKFKLNNDSGTFTNFPFGGAEIFLTISTKDWEAQSDDLFTIDMGYFIIDQNPRRLSTISITALDRMAKYDMAFNPSSVDFENGATIQAIIEKISEDCNVGIETDLTTLPNYDYVVYAPPADTVTCRQILQWCAELTGTCAYIGYDGDLRLEWYHETYDDGGNLIPVPVLDPSNRYSSDIYENDIVLTGVQATTEEEDIIAGAEGYMFNIEGNELLQYDHQTVVDNIWAAISGSGFYSYRPFEAVTKSAPYIYPLDVMVYEQADGTQINTFCTHSNFSMNKNSKLAAKGETEQDNKLILANPMTSRQRVIIQNLRQEVTEQITDRLQAVDQFSQLVANALGVWFTAVPQPGGGNYYYLHDAEILENSTNIYAMVGGAFVWTNNGWQGGPENWTDGGIDANGNAIFNFIMASGIEVSTPTSDYSSSMKPDGFGIDYRGQSSILMTALKTIVTDLVVGQRLTSGKIQLVPNEAGADFVYVD